MTIRLKLTMGSIAVILVANALLSLVVVEYLQDVWLNEVQTRVRLDLNSARAIYDSHLQRVAAFLQAAALDQALGRAVARPDAKELPGLLRQLQKTGRLEIVTVLDLQGRVVLRAGDPGQKGDDFSRNPVVAKAIRSRQVVAGTTILSAQQLAAEGGDLAARARFRLLPSPGARPTKEDLRGDGMVAAAAVPLWDAKGQLIGLLFGGNLQNRRNEMVDAIREEVFPTSLYEGAAIGSVTLFQGDLRIATNVVQPNGARAVGTRLSQEVYQRVLVEGVVWSAPARVLNDWYITAYGPIRDPDEKIIGALYVGQPQAPFLHKRNTVTVVVLILVLVATIASLVLVFLLTELILRPVGKIVAMVRQVVQGDLSARVGIRPPGEIGVLCRAVDHMADALAEREAKLKAFTRQQINRSEKLASLGRLAAGVAHEINNPLTGVLTFAHLLREKPNLDDQDKQDLDLIIRETTRAAEIVRGLLDFARERAAIKEPLHINDVIRRTIRLIRNQKSYDRIVITEELKNDLPEVEGDMNQLQQVMLNLSLNACEAMTGGGTLTIRSETDDGHVRIAVTDTGCGIKREHYDQIFEPFFTTKPVGKGTGLGLAVTYGIVEQHGGMLEFVSEEGRGTTFTVILPALGMGPVEQPETRPNRTP
jgi:two-component system NtrC family sensor kinase